MTNRWRPSFTQCRVLISLVSHRNLPSTYKTIRYALRICSTVTLIKVHQSGKALLIKMELSWIKVGRYLNGQVENQRLGFSAQFVLTLMVWGTLTEPRTELSPLGGKPTLRNQVSCPVRKPLLLCVYWQGFELIVSQQTKVKTIANVTAIPT